MTRRSASRWGGVSALRWSGAVVALSMDSEVFLLPAVRETWQRTADADGGVGDQYGLPGRFSRTL